MKRSIILFIVLIAIVWGCGKKKYPESFSENAPVFYFKANINNAVVEYSAGVNNYRLFSSYNQDSNNVYNLIAELKQTTCNGKCPNSLRLQINDFKKSQAGANIIIDSALAIKNYSFADSLKGFNFPVQFTSTANKDVESYTWDFGDGSQSNLANPNHNYKTEGKYRVSLIARSTNGNVSSIWNDINISNINKLNANIYVTTPANFTNIVFNTNIYGGVSADSILWSFGDGTIARGNLVSHTFPYEGSYPVKLKLTDQNFNQLDLNYNAVTQKDKSSFAINFTSMVGVSEKNALALSKIIVNYIDENGIEYTNLNKQKSVNNTFQILSHENFETNENNQTTKKIKIKFSCTLYNGNKALDINNAEAVIAVAYK